MWRVPSRPRHTCFLQKRAGGKQRLREGVVPTVWSQSPWEPDGSRLSATTHRAFSDAASSSSRLAACCCPQCSNRAREPSWIWI